MEKFLIVCPFVFLAGFVDAIAGGGGLIAFPAYVFAGVPVHIIIGTSKLGAFPGAIVAMLRFAKSGFVKWKLAIPCGIAGFIGAILGALITLRLDASIVEKMMFVVLPVVAFYMLRNKNAVSDEVISGLTEKQIMTYGILASLIIGGYNGFYGPGCGTFLLLAFTGLVKLNTKEAAGLTKVVNLAADVGGLCAFATFGQIDLMLGIASAIFCMLGSYFGSGIVANNGQKIVRPVILIVLALLFAKLIFGF